MPKRRQPEQQNILSDLTEISNKAADTRKLIEAYKERTGLQGQKKRVHGIIPRLIDELAVGQSTIQRRFQIIEKKLQDGFSFEDITWVDFERGRKPLLSYDEEVILVKEIERAHASNQSLGPKQVGILASSLVEKIGKGPKGWKPSAGYIRGLQKRFPQVKEAIAWNARDKVVDDGVSEDSVRRWFSEIREKMKKPGGSVYDPRSLFSFDVIPLKDDLSKDEVGEVRDGVGRADGASLVSCVSAAGDALPHLLILKGTKLPTEVEEAVAAGQLEGLKIKMSDSGGMTPGLFEYWFDEVFIQSLPEKSDPILLLMDLERIKTSVEVLTKAKIRRVSIFQSIPSSALPQPLDRSPLRVLRQQMKTYKKQKGSLRSRNLPFLLPSIHNKVFSKQNITSAFRQSCIYPIDEEAAVKQLPPHNRTIPLLDVHPAESCATHSTTDSQEGDLEVAARRSPCDSSVSTAERLQILEERVERLERNITLKDGEIRQLKRALTSVEDKIRQQKQSRTRTTSKTKK